MNEKQLIKAVERNLDSSIHKQSMTSASLTHGGTPDRYYDGPKRDLWVEYKMLRNMPRSGYVIGCLSDLQKAWLRRRFEHSLPTPNVAVIVGLPNKTACIQTTELQWCTGTSVFDSFSLKEVSAWINAFCGGS